MRTLKAKQISTGNWLQRVDAGDKSESGFSQEVADQFSILITDVQVIIEQLTSAEYDAVVAELASGTHQGLPVTAAPVNLASSELTISSGNITPIGGIHSVDTESDAATDDLANILTTNLPDESLLYIRANNTARTVVIKHVATGAGQINLADSADLSLDDDLKWVLLQRRGADWFEVFRDISDHNVAANVHGLPASVNVLGNLAASGECVQRGVLNPANLLAGGNTIYIGGASTVTFAVAFSSSPKVSPGGTTDNQIESAFCFNIGTTAFTYRPFGTSASQVNTNGQYIALGA